MQRRRIEKNLIFYIPGKPGSVFTYQAGRFITDRDIHDIVSHLEQDTGQQVSWVEDRRAYYRTES